MTRGLRMRLTHSAWTLIGAMVMVACRSGMPLSRDPSTLPTAESALDAVRARTADRGSLRATGRVTYFGDRGRIRLRTIVLAQRPGAFRVETLSPLEQPIDVMASDGHEVWLLTKGRLFTGPATPEHIARLLPLPLPPEAVVDILLGGVPASRGLKATGISWEADLWKVDVEGIGQEQGALWVDPALRVTKRWVMLEDSDQERVRLTFDDFGEVAGTVGPFPREIQVVLASPEADVQIKLDTPELGVRLDDGLFRIVPPPGIEPEPL